VRVKGVRRCTNAVLHPWLEAELAQILAALPEPDLATTYRLFLREGESENAIKPSEDWDSGDWNLRLAGYATGGEF
jgi:hypothetical protein